jgi:tetratricopeptide (TPR) repeat protein
MTSPRPAPCQRALVIVGLCVLLTPTPRPLLAAAKVEASTGQLTLPTYPWAAVKHPYFRGTDKVNIYPYPMLDFLSREKTNRTYRTVVLENEYLRITFLPELGGKIHEVIDKTTGQPMFYVNHVIKPGLIGQCGAWTSGGVEWNTGPQGHTVGCMQPVEVMILPREEDGSRSVAIGETERIYGTRWTVVVTLRPGRSFIEERIRIYNPTETIRPYYFWNCTAVPNTPGFRFIYPMTLGTDHGSEKFFNWPIHEGKDLTRGTNYQDASSIFAWHCDQDFFGSYDNSVDRGVVSYANHHQLPGKKAWTWGQGGFGRMHQMDLTDTDGPYNEVQTGPLLTQGEVGRLDPCEAVEWKEWWYPVHGIGGFTFANKDVAVNAAVEGGELRLRLLGTGSWSPVDVVLSQGTSALVRAACRLVANQPTDLHLDSRGSELPFKITVAVGKRALAQFRVPLDLPMRKPPEKKPKPETATELAQAGWEQFLFAKLSEAEAHYRKALEKDPKCVAAHTGMAYLNLDRDLTAASQAAQAALATAPHDGLTWLALARAALAPRSEATLDQAWQASLDPATAVAGRALAAKILLGRGEWDRAIAALDGPGPWENDLVCRNRRAFALLMSAPTQSSGAAARRAVLLARTNLEADPLDAFARMVLWLAGAEDKSMRLGDLVEGQAQPVLDLAVELVGLGQEQTALRVLSDFYLRQVAPESRDPLTLYWAAYLTTCTGRHEAARKLLTTARSLPARGVYPYRGADAIPLVHAFAENQSDSRAALFLGHAFFHMGRHADGRGMWKKALELDTDPVVSRRPTLSIWDSLDGLPDLGAEPVIAHRALGMAALTLDNDADTAAKHLARAHELDRTDAIVARDLAKVVFTQADKADSPDRKKELWARARDTLQAAFAQGRGRSDFVALLARAQSRLGEHAETARMLDSVRVTVWEGSREVHDLFVEAHLALGQAHLEANRPAEALAEFNRALEYPENLATGKLENAREAHIQFLRGNALAKLGQKQDAIAAWKKAADETASKDPRIEQARKQAREALESAQRAP